MDSVKVYLIPGIISTSIEGSQPFEIIKDCFIIAPDFGPMLEYPVIAHIQITPGIIPGFSLLQALMWVGDRGELENEKTFNMSFPRRAVCTGRSNPCHLVRYGLSSLVTKVVTD